MRITFLFLCLTPLISVAQEPVDVDPPKRHIIGFDLGRPIAIMFLPKEEWKLQIEWTYGFQYRDRRTWRFGHRWLRNAYEWQSTDAMDSIRYHYFGAYDQAIHHISIGHQWRFSDRRLRPFVGIDAIGGLRKFSRVSYTYRETYDTSTSQWGPMEEWAFNTTRYDIWVLGAAAAAGLEYELPGHLLIQLRMTAGYLHGFSNISSNFIQWEVRENAPYPEVGTGLFVVYRF